VSGLAPTIVEMERGLVTRKSALRDGRPSPLGVEKYSLLEPGEGHHVRWYVVNLAPSAEVASHASDYPALVYVARGPLVLTTPRGDEWLQTGDCVTLATREKHGWRVPSDAPGATTITFRPEN
jgi:quercetin dioxygenase-like cupin family protein